MKYSGLQIIAGIEKRAQEQYRSVTDPVTTAQAFQDWQRKNWKTDLAASFVVPGYMSAASLNDAGLAFKRKAYLAGAGHLAMAGITALPLVGGAIKSLKYGAKGLATANRFSKVAPLARRTAPVGASMMRRLGVRGYNNLYRPIRNLATGGYNRLAQPVASGVYNHTAAPVNRAVASRLGYFGAKHPGLVRGLENAYNPIQSGMQRTWAGRHAFPLAIGASMLDPGPAGPGLVGSKAPAGLNYVVNAGQNVVSNVGIPMTREAWNESNVPPDMRAEYNAARAAERLAARNAARLGPSRSMWDAWNESNVPPDMRAEYNAARAAARQNQ